MVAMADQAEMRLLHMYTTGDLNRNASFAYFADPNYFLTDFPTSTCLTCINPAFAWNHGDIQPDIATTWLGFVGPGVQHLGRTDDIWTDHTDVRPTMLALLGLHDTYATDGRAIAEIFRADAGPKTLHRNQPTLSRSGPSTSSSTRRSGSSRRRASASRPTRSRAGRRPTTARTPPPTHGSPTGRPGATRWPPRSAAMIAAADGGTAQPRRGPRPAAHRPGVAAHRRGRRLDGLGAQLTHPDRRAAAPPSDHVRAPSAHRC